MCAVNGITPQADVHFRDAVEHLHLTDMLFILHPLLISYEGKPFQTTSSSSVSSCQPIVSVGSFSRFIIAWSV